MEDLVPADPTTKLFSEDQLQPAPLGVAGELYVGGAGVARGYRNRPDLTAERFVTGPDGARLYRTGDRVRRLAGGGLAFLGRADDQVKIRGYRVELDEIVAALDTHPGVKASAVVARPGAGGELRLVAYLVASPDAKLTPSALLATLRARLPDYMLPSVFVPIDELPLMASGKVDRSRLPDPEQAETLRDPEFEAPRNPVERRLADLVAALLGVARVGVGDNFFLLGGHSLLGTQLIARLRDAFGVDLPLRVLVWEDEAGNIWLTYRPPELLAQRHHVVGRDEAVKALDTGVQALARAATAKSTHAVILSPARKVAGAEARYPDHTPSVIVLTPSRPSDTTVTWIRELFGWPRNVTDWPGMLAPAGVLNVKCTYCVGGSVRL